MEDKIISFEIAKLAKHVGFDEPCKYYYWEDTTDKVNTMTYYKDITNSGLIKSSKIYQKGLQGCEFCSAPTQSHLQKWLRERSVMIWVEPTYYDGWLYLCKIAYPNGDHVVVGKEDGSWEDQLEEGLLAGLNYIMEKQ